jgi:hypothetical protein
MKSTLGSVGGGIAAAAITYLIFGAVDALPIAARVGVALVVGVVGFVMAVLLTDAPVKGRIVILRKVRAKGNVSAEDLDVTGKDVEIATDIRSRGDVTLKNVNITRGSESKE